MELSRIQETEIKAFAQKLNLVSGPDDMFPPESGVREPLPQPRPSSPARRQLGFAAIDRAASVWSEATVYSKNSGRALDQRDCLVV